MKQVQYYWEMQHLSCNEAHSTFDHTCNVLSITWYFCFNKGLSEGIYRKQTCKGDVQEKRPAMKNMFKPYPAGKLQRSCSDDKNNHIFTKNGSMCSLSSGCMFRNDFRLRVATKFRVHLPHSANFHDGKKKKDCNFCCDPQVLGKQSIPNTQ